MNSLVLSTATRYLMPLLLLFSIFLLLRGHNEPGGGFVGGLVLSAAFILFVLANGVDAARRILIVEPRSLILVGLAIALASALVAPAMGLPFMTGMWIHVPLALIGKLGTPQVFDIGVYFVVGGVSLTILFSLAD